MIGAHAAVALAGLTVVVTGMLFPLTPVQTGGRLAPLGAWVTTSVSLLGVAALVYLSRRRAAQADDAYRSLDARWRQIMNQTRGMVAVLDLEGRVIDVNATGEAVTGLPAEEMKGYPVWKAPFLRGVGEEPDRSRTACRLAASGSAQRYDAEFLTADGAPCVADVSVQPVRWDGDDVSHLLIEALDVTERRTLEKDLESMQAFYRTLLEDTAIAFAVVDREGRFTYTNAAMGKLLGYQERELIGRPTSDIVHPADATDLVLREEPSRIRVRHADGTWRTFQMVARDRTGDESIRGFVAAGYDITGEAEADRRIREREAFFSALLDSGFGGVSVIDGATARSKYTSATEAALGYTEAEFQAAEAEDPLALIHPDDREAANASRLEVLERGSVETEFRVRHKDGRWRRMQVSARDLSDHPAIGGVVSQFRDITDLRDEQERAKALAEELRASEMMTTMGALVAGVAHEVRNPLFAITATLDALEEQVRTGRPEVIGEHFEVLRVEVARLSDLMQDLLHYGRSGTSTRVSTGLGPTLSEAVRDCRQASREAEVEISVSAEPVPVRVSIDSGRVQLALRNLVRNAVQHAGAGGHVSVVQRERSDGSRMWLDCLVRDSGPGVAEELLPHVFEPFVSRRVGGTGLGLAIVRRIAQEHSAEVGVTNPPGGGAEFRFSLPVADA